MKLKIRLTVSRIIILIMGMIFAVVGFKKDTLWFSMGIAMVVVTLIRLPGLISLFRDETKFKEYEKAYYDERNIYLAQKSYSTSFWFSILGEFIALCIFSYSENTYSTMMSYIICSQLIIYVLARIYFGKKY